jgi:hypothetical protein
LRYAPGMLDDSEADGLHLLSMGLLAAGVGVLFAAGVVVVASFGLPALPSAPGRPLPDESEVRLTDGSTRGRSWFEGRAWVVNLWSPW